MNSPSKAVEVEKDEMIKTYGAGPEKLAKIESRMLYPSLPKPCDRTWLHEYAMLHTAIMSGEISPDATKYVIVRPHERAGLGNRIRAIHGAFAFAVITQRAILFDFHDRLNDTEVAFLDPPLLHLFEQYKIDWRLPLNWPHQWSPFIQTIQTQSDNNVKVINSQIGTGRGKIKPLRKDGVKPFYNNLESFFKTATVDDLKPNVKCIVFDSQVGTSCCC